MALFWNRKSDIDDEKSDIEAKLSDIQNHNHGDLVYTRSLFLYIWVLSWYYLYITRRIYKSRSKLTNEYNL